MTRGDAIAHVENLERGSNASQAKVKLSQNCNSTLRSESRLHTVQIVAAVLFRSAFNHSL